MSDKIKKSDISEKDPFGNLGKSALDAKADLDMLNISMKVAVETAKIIKSSLKNTKPKNTEAIKKANTLSTQANIIAKEKAVLDKKLNILNSTAIQKNTELNEQLKIQRKTNIRLAKDKLGLISAYQKESKRLVDLRNKYKDLALQNKHNTKEGRALLKNVTRLDRKMKKLDSTVGQSQRHVGDYGRAIKRLRGGMLRLAGAFGLVGGIAAFARGIRNAFNKIVEFQKANAELAAVLGTTRKQIGTLTTDAKRLGSQTIFTASQVTGLQKAFAKLGFSAGEILGVTEATLNLATATSTELPRAAEVVGNTLRAFQLDSRDTTRLVDLMTKSFNTSALDMEKFSTAMATVAPVAASAGFTLERTTAILGMLANNGVDASTAGTGLRNILLDLNKHGLTFEQAMKKINTSTNKTKTAFELFGKRGATVATIIANNTENIKELDKALEAAGGTAERVAEEQMATLSGAMKEATSAWEGFIFSMESGDGIISKVASRVVRNITWILNKLTELNKTSLEILNENIGIAEKSAVGFTSAAAKVSTDAFGQVEKSVKQLNEELKITKKATTGIFTDEEFGNIQSYNQKIIDLKNEGLTDVEIKLALIKDQQKGAFSFLNDESLATKGLEELNRELDKNKKITEESLKNIEAARPVTQTRLPFIGGDDEADKKIAADQAIFDAQLARNRGRIENFASDVASINTAVNSANKQFQNVIKSASDAEIATILSNTNDENIIRIAQLEQLARSQRQLNDDVEEGAKKGSSAAKEENTRLRELKLMLKANRMLAEKLVTENTDASNAELLALNKKGQLLDSQIDKIKELLKLEAANKKGDLEKIALLGAEFEAQKKLIAADPNKLSLDDRFFDEAKVERDLAIEKARIRLEFNKKELKINEDALMENFDVESKFFEESQRLRLEAITLENEIRTLKFEEAQEELYKNEEDLQIAFLDKKLDLNKENTFKINQDALQRTIDRLTEEEKLATANIINADGTVNQDAVDKSKALATELSAVGKQKADEEVKFTEEKNKTIEQLDIDLQKALIKSHIKRLDNRRSLLKTESLEHKQLTREIFELQQESNDLDKPDEEIAEQKYERRGQLVDIFTQKFLSDADKRIAKINEEIAAATRQANVLAGLAASGNITAKESLRQQDEIIREANLRKEQEEKRKQQIMIVSATLQAYNSALAGGATPSEALTSSITNTLVLKEFVEALPTFLDGIDDTGTHGQGIDGKGGFHAILHPNERVMTKEQNEKMHGYSNEDVARIVNDYQYGSYAVKMSDNGSSSFDTKKIEDGLASVREEIKNKEVPNIELGQITQAAMVINQTIKRGNWSTTNSFKVKS